MADWIRLAATTALTDGSGGTFRSGELEVALFRRGNEWSALTSRCPHADAPLGRGAVQDGVVRCPLHGWRFELHSGRCPERPGVSVSVFPTRIDGESVWIDVAANAEGREARDESLKPVSSERNDSNSDAAPAKQTARYLVRYGALGWIGLFDASPENEFQRHETVLIKTMRGTEAGELLSKVSASDPAAEEHASNGEILRAAEADELQNRKAHSSELLGRMIPDVQKRLDEQELAIEILDGEVLFEGDVAILYFVGESAPEAGPLVTEIAHGYGLARIELAPFLELEPAGCGKPGCGGGGCSVDEPH